MTYFLGMTLAELLLASLHPEGLTDPVAKSQIAMVAQILREFEIETAHELTEALHRAAPVLNEGELSRLQKIFKRFTFTSTTGVALMKDPQHKVIPFPNLADKEV